MELDTPHAGHGHELGLAKENLVPLPCLQSDVAPFTFGVGVQYATWKPVELDTPHAGHGHELGLAKENLVPLPRDRLYFGFVYASQACTEDFADFWRPL